MLPNFGELRSPLRRLAIIAVSVFLLSKILTAESTTEYHIQKATRTDDRVTVWVTTSNAEYVLSCKTRAQGCVVLDDSIRYTFDTLGGVALFSIKTGPSLYVVEHAFNIISVTYRLAS